MNEKVRVNSDENTFVPLSPSNGSDKDPEHHQYNNDGLLSVSNLEPCHETRW